MLLILLRSYPPGPPFSSISTCSTDLASARLKFSRPRDRVDFYSLGAKVSGRAPSDVVCNPDVLRIASCIGRGVHRNIARRDASPFCGNTVTHHDLQLRRAPNPVLTCGDALVDPDDMGDRGWLAPTRVPAAEGCSPKPSQR